MFWQGSEVVIPNISPYEVQDVQEKRDTTSKVLTISDSGKLKNLKRLLKAWPSVIELLPGAELNLVGNGLGERDGIALWATDNGLNHSINWHGYLDRAGVRELLSSADVLVHPSLEESFGLTFLEAMAFGIPVIGGSKSGAVPWIVKNAGLLINVKSSTQIAESIIRLLKDSDLRQELSANGQNRIKEEFRAEKVAFQYAMLYKKVLGN